MNDDELGQAREFLSGQSGGAPSGSEILLYLIWKELRRSAIASERANENSEAMRKLYERRDREQREERAT